MGRHRAVRHRATLSSPHTSPQRLIEVDRSREDPDVRDTIEAYLARCGLTDRPGVEYAIHAVAADPSPTDRRNFSRCRLAVEVLSVDADRHAGEVDVARAFAPSTLDRFVGVRYATSPSSTQGTMRSDLRRVAKTLIGDPEVARIGFARSKAKPPTSSAELSRAWRLTQTLPTELGTQIAGVLALCAGVGARPAEAQRVTVADIGTVRTARGDQMTVTLVKTTGEARVVPVVDDRAAAHLAKVASDRTAQDPVLAGGGIRKNVVNSVNARLKKVRPDLLLTIDPYALRHSWVSLLAQSPVPTATLMQLADIGDTKLLADLRPYWRVVETVAAARALEVI